MDFVAIDFETARPEMYSACSIGLVKVHDYRIVDEKYALIRPPDMRFSRRHIMIHGIKPGDVAGQPVFADIWPELRDFIGSFPVVAHYAQFDIGVLKGALDYYRLPYPELTYACSCVIAKMAWPGLPSYRLNLVAEHLDIRFCHHHALEDARVSGEIVIRAGQAVQARDMEDLGRLLHFSSGHLSPAGDRGVRYSRKKTRPLS